MLETKIMLLDLQKSSARFDGGKTSVSVPLAERIMVLRATSSVMLNEMRRCSDAILGAKEKLSASITDDKNSAQLFYDALLLIYSVLDKPTGLLAESQKIPENAACDISDDCLAVTAYLGVHEKNRQDGARLNALEDAAAKALEAANSQPSNPALSNTIHAMLLILGAAPVLSPSEKPPA